MEKTLRVLGGDEDGAGHSHSHSHASGETAEASGVADKDKDGLRSRKGGKKDKTEAAEAAKSTGPSKMSAYLNLFGDFVHNMWVYALSWGCH
jgi:zinc transporter 7